MFLCVYDANGGKGRCAKAAHGTPCVNPPSPPPAPPRLPRPPGLPSYALYTGWEHYRFGDEFLYGASRFRNKRSYYLDVWPDSLVSQYLRATDEDGNFGVMAGIIRERGRAAAPPADVAAVHVRVGDIFEATAASLDFMFDASRMCDHWSIAAFWQGHEAPPTEWEMAIRHYVMDRRSYEEHLDALRALGVRTVVLVAGSHVLYDAYPRSSIYLNLVRDWFVANGFEVDFRLGRAPDDDVSYMASARVLIQSGGGFSAAIARLCRLLGGTVLCASQFLCEPDTREVEEWAHSPLPATGTTP